MAELLLELYSEEIPPQLQIEARSQLKQFIENSFKENHLKYKDLLINGGSANHDIPINTSNIRNIQCSNLPTTDGSKSTKTARGTCFPAPVSWKNVENESSPTALALGI